MFARVAPLFAFFVGLAYPSPIPNTPAGQILHAWLDAYNSGNRTRMEAFVQKYEPKDTADGMMAFHAMTGRLELLAIEKTDGTHITFRVRQNASLKTATGQLDVTNAAPAQIVALNFMGLQDLTDQQTH